MKVDFKLVGEEIHFRFSDEGKGQFLLWMERESARQFAHDILNVLDGKELCD